MSEGHVTEHKKENDMTKKPNHNADMKNGNKGTPGQNKTRAVNQGNRGKQLNPQQTQPKKAN